MYSPLTDKRYPKHIVFKKTNLFIFLGVSLQCILPKCDFTCDDDGVARLTVGVDGIKV